MNQNIPSLTENQVKHLLDDVFLTQIERINLSNIIVATKTDHVFSEFECKLIEFTHKRGTLLNRYLPKSEEFNFAKLVDPSSFELKSEGALCLAQHIRLLQNSLAGLLVDKINIADITITYTGKPNN